jgi:primase-polymerase (primpol)-like protein
LKPENIPAELRALKRFGTWCYVYDQERRGWKKLPNPPFKQNQPDSWITFDEAIEKLKKKSGDGLGMALPNEGDVIAFDFDDCIKANIVDPTVQRYLNRVGRRAHIEISVGGEGVRVVGRGVKPKGAREKCSPKGKASEYPEWSGVSSLEVYDGSSARYVTLTGHTLPGSTSELGDISDVAAELCAHIDKVQRRALVQTQAYGEIG